MLNKKYIKNISEDNLFCARCDKKIAFDEYYELETDDSEDGKKTVYYHFFVEDCLVGDIDGDAY